MIVTSLNTPQIGSFITYVPTVGLGRPRGPRFSDYVAALLFGFGLLTVGLLTVGCSVEPGTLGAEGASGIARGSEAVSQECLPDDARPIGTCKSPTAVAWDGVKCAYVVGCDCEGADCTKYETIDACKKAHETCTAPAVQCAADIAKGVGLCEAVVGFMWNGSECTFLSGCSCEGRDCKKYSSFDDCDEAHRGCARPAQCEADDAHGVGASRKRLQHWSWNGRECKRLVGKRCQGDDCGKYKSLQECHDEHIGCLDPCRAFDVAPKRLPYELVCRVRPLYYWNGDSCQRYSECTCRGLDCTHMYRSYQDCQAAHLQCLEPPTPNPNSVCAAVLCPTGTRCQPKQVQCIKEPCNPIAECVPDDPCSGTTINILCAPKYHCVLKEEPCNAESCPRNPVCEPDEASAPGCEGLDAQACGARADCEAEWKGPVCPPGQACIAIAYFAGCKARTTTPTP